MTKIKKPDTLWQTALYCRLSREDGDRPESDSIGNQRKLLTEYIQDRPEFELVDCYTDDGYTGTNFDRPAFLQLLRDIEAGRVNCILVKDLSRFGRDYIDAGRYLERWLPDHGTRFIAVTDNIDSNRGAYDMMMPLKNLFNAQYAKDISQKVKSSLHTKQQHGEFIGAFPSYGYLKDPANRNHLLVDPVAAQVVQRIFTLFEHGFGKIKIAKILNQEGVPCPSEYKRLMGERYRNGNRLDHTTYWTYTTIHRILQNEMYIGNMEQGRDNRVQIHGAAQRKEKAEWVIVEGTHEAIIPQERWKRVQALMNRNARTPTFSSHVSPFAGYLKCGDCGRSMAKTVWQDRTFYTCGSYKRYGVMACSKHYIAQSALEEIVLNDLNRIIASVKNLQMLADRGKHERKKVVRAGGEQDRLSTALARVQRMKQRIYEDCREGLISKDEFFRYRKDYEAQEEGLWHQLKQRKEAANGEDLPIGPWVENLVRLGRLSGLDRATIAEIIKEIRIFESGDIEVTYLFSDALCVLLEDVGNQSHAMSQIQECAFWK